MRPTLLVSELDIQVSEDGGEGDDVQSIVISLGLGIASKGEGEAKAVYS